MFNQCADKKHMNHPVRPYTYLYNTNTKRIVSFSDALLSSNIVYTSNTHKASLISFIDPDTTIDCIYDIKKQGVVNPADRSPRGIRRYLCTGLAHLLGTQYPQYRGSFHPLPANIVSIIRNAFPDE
eukprot:28505_1